MSSLTRIAPVVAFVACSGGGVTQPAQFDKATPQAIERAIIAGVDGDAQIGLILAVGFASFPAGATACPSIATSGTTVTVTGGCTTDTGERIDGSVQIDNLQGLSAAQASTVNAGLTFDHFTLSGSGEEFELDGSISLSGSAGASTMSANLDDSLLGLEAISNIDASCTATGCSIDSGATIAIPDIGDADVSGLFDNNGGSVAITLTAADKMAVTSNGSGCYTYSISDGATGELCGSGS